MRKKSDKRNCPICGDMSTTTRHNHPKLAIREWWCSRCSVWFGDPNGTKR